MLGKRFRRSTSMSQLGPGSCNHPPPEKSDNKEYSIVPCCVPPSGAENENEECHDVDCSGGGDANMVHESGPSHMLTDTIITESPPCEGYEELSIEAHEESCTYPFDQAVHSPSPLVPYQMGLWTHDHVAFGPHVNLGKLQLMNAEASIVSPVDFLDVCFFCKRRLRHERDIFIYRGDSAFCSEECRHRQILSDERRSMRGAKNKRGGARATSETAVAA